MQFSPENHEKLCEAIDVYKKAKTIILYSEEQDEEQKALIQTYKELRDAFDHLMRVLASQEEYEKHKLSEPDANQRINVNIEKCISHIFRAAFDAVDLCVITFKEKIYNAIKPFSSDILIKCIDDYGQLKIRIEEINENIVTFRNEKDTTVDGSSTILNRYIQEIDELKSIYKKIHHSLPTLEKMKQDEKRAFWKENGLKFLIGLLVGVAVTSISFFLFGH